MALASPRVSALANGLPLFRQWMLDGFWQRLHTRLREALRESTGRQPTPRAGVIDSQSVKITGRGGLHGFDGAKKVNGRKRHILVDTLGLLVHGVVSPANVQDTLGAYVLLQQVVPSLPRLQHIWVDNGYRGAFITAVKQQFGVTIEVVQQAWKELTTGRWLRADEEPRTVSVPKGFQVLPRRWVIERTFAWLGMFRRLSKDYEFLLETSETMIYLVMTQIMLKRLTQIPDNLTP
jgi:putative transposase